MYDKRFCRSEFLVSCFLMFVFSLGLALQLHSADNANLFKDVVGHKDQIQWRTYNAPKLPDDVCNYFSTCSGDKAEPKVFTLPPTTIDGRQVGRALFLTQTKDVQHPAVILEHQTPNVDVYFFLLSPDGSLQKTIWVERGKPYMVIANSLAQSKFDRDKKDWQDWASKLGH